MNIRNLTIIALRLLAVVAFMRLSHMLTVGFVVIQSGSLPEAVKSQALPVFLVLGIWLLTVLFYFVALWALLWRTPIVADFLLRDVGEERLNALPDLEMLSALVCHCFGLYALLRWLPPLAYALLRELPRRSGYGGDAAAFLGQLMLGLVSPAVGVLLGIVLLLHGAGIARWLATRTAQTASTEGTK